MGGSLASPLTCGEDTNIKTYFSERLIPDTDFDELHFVEILSNDVQNSVEYAKYRFLTHHHDIEKIENIIDLEDNLAHQCRRNSRACFDTEDSFTKEIDILFFVEEIFEANGTHKAVHEGIREYGLK